MSGSWSGWSTRRASSSTVPHKSTSSASTMASGKRFRSATLMSVRSLANSKATTPLSDDATRISPSELGPHAKRMRSDLDSDLDPDLASAMASGLLGVVKNDADGMTQPAADPADAVSEIDAVCAFRAFHRPIVDGED